MSVRDSIKGYQQFIICYMGAIESYTIQTYFTVLSSVNTHLSGIESRRSVQINNKSVYALKSKSCCFRPQKTNLFLSVMFSVKKSDKRFIFLA